MGRRGESPGAGRLGRACRGLRDPSAGAAAERWALRPPTTLRPGPCPPPCPERVRPRLIGEGGKCRLPGGALFPLHTLSLSRRLRLRSTVAPVLPCGF